MAYATLQDLITRYGEQRLIEMTDRFDPPAEVIDEGVVAKALQDASDRIDGYVRVVYALPLTETPAMLRGLAEDIAFFLLYEEPTDEARKRYTEAVATLRDISAGRVKLPIAQGAESPSRPAVVHVTSQPRRFSRQSMGGL
ncbi:DUF1320 domain-containing protein [Brevundimonas vitis]|uniref:DUF1320 domain-containing protein n=1 Tax=Brevundimonas vitisensis TaxID=2800818 RepID=A0ABX7BQE6_9CAUL|nr:DUF1320 domain-containing protein [Brevundimonas vitisensis]QQQ19675.1 DUF1320 domain-containing protein [Brevundimonas vitisensis]